VQERTRRWLFAGCVTALAVALGTVGWLGWQRPADAPASSSGPLAVVLLPDISGSTLVVVDLRSGTVARRIALRSTVTDIAVDASSGLVVAAQAGGFGVDVDRAASLTDVRSGTVRYVELATDDPGDVACTGGRAFLLHATVDASGTVVSVVDVAGARLVATGHVPAPPGLWGSAGGAVWTTGEDAVGGPSLRRVDPRTLSVSPFALSALVPLGLAEADGRPLVLGASGGAERAAGALAVIDPANGSAVATTRVSGLVRPPSIAAQVGDRLVVGDWNGDEPEGRVLRVLDVATLRDRGALPVDGVPCALAAWGDRLLVVDRERGRLLVIDPADGRTLSAIDLGETNLVFSDVVVVGESGGS
jgi:hypothetical protein